LRLRESKLKFAVLRKIFAVGMVFTEQHYILVNNNFISASQLSVKSLLAHVQGERARRCNCPGTA
jgi:hypothetical protein